MTHYWHRFTLRYTAKGCYPLRRYRISTSVFALQLNCRRSSVILDSDPQFLPLIFVSFFFSFALKKKRRSRKRREFDKEIKENASYFFLEFFGSIFRDEGLHLTAIFCGRFPGKSKSINVNK